MSSTPTAVTAAEKTDDRTDQFVQMDVMDEKQIIEELKGHVIEEYFYEFTDKGKLRVGLSFSGVKFMAEYMKSENILLSIIHTDIRQTVDGKSWIADAACQDLKTGAKRNGHAQQKIMDGERENPFAYTLAGSKAERNAMRHFIPEPAIKAAYTEWKAKKGGGTVAERAARAKDVTPPPKPAATASTPSTPPPAAPPVETAGDPDELAEPITREQLEYKLRDETALGTVRLIEQPGGTILVQKNRSLRDTEFAKIDGLLRDHGAKYDSKVTGWPVQTVAEAAAKAS